jgi:predicted RNase H-like HicB family nuclease
MKEYAVIYAWAGKNWSAHSPDVPGVIATAKTREEIERKFKSALEFHFEGLREDGLPIPEPKTQVGTVKIAA